MDILHSLRDKLRTPYTNLDDKLWTFSYTSFSDNSIEDFEDKVKNEYKMKFSLFSPLFLGTFYTICVKINFHLIVPLIAGSEVGKYISPDRWLAGWG